MYTCQSPCVSRSFPSLPFCTPYRRFTSITDAVHLSRSFFRSFHSLPLALVLVTYTFSPSPASTTNSLNGSVLFIPQRSAWRSRLRSTLGGPHPRIVGWRGTPCGTTYPLPPSFHPFLRPLPFDSSLFGIPLPLAAIVHPNIAGEERIVTMARSI